MVELGRIEVVACVTYQPTYSLDNSAEFIETCVGLLFVVSHSINGRYVVYTASRVDNKYFKGTLRVDNK